MAITPDTIGGNVALASSTVTLSYTLATGAQLWALVIGRKAGDFPGIPTLTFNGQSVRVFWDQNDATNLQVVACESFETAFQVTGDGAPHNLVATFNKTVDVGIIFASSFFGASSAAPDDGTSVSGTSTAPSSGSISPGAGTLVLDAVAIDANLTPTPNGAQTLVDNDHSNGLGFGLSSRAGGSTFSMDWTIGSSQLWFSQSIVLTPAVAAEPFELEAGRRFISIP